MGTTSRKDHGTGNSRMKQLSALFLLLYLAACTPKLSQQKADAASPAVDYYQEKHPRYEDHVYEDHIRTVLFYNSREEQSAPLLTLGAGERLLFSFDELGTSVSNFTYTVEHCTSGWQPSGLAPNEYLQNFSEERITEYKFSFNTLQNYIHYSLELPNEIIQPILSGNYLLKVYRDNDPDNLVITRRFMIYQQKVDIAATVARSSVINDRNLKQKINFTIRHPELKVSNPFDELRIVIMQNERWDHAKTTVKPVFIRENELIYDAEDENVFNGGNEFRRFDVRSMRFYAEQIDSIARDTLYKVFLFPDRSRRSGRYATELDNNGRFFIRFSEGTNPALEADYVQVQFTLPYTYPLSNGSFYLFGKFTDWKLNRRSRMNYNETLGAYESTVLVKQGVYNYQYVFLADGNRDPDESLTEGSFFETENLYTILVYHKAIGSRYEELIGVKYLNSNPVYR